MDDFNLWWFGSGGQERCSVQSSHYQAAHTAYQAGRERERSVSACSGWLARLEAVADELESKPVNDKPEWGFERVAAARQIRDLISEAREAC